MKTEGKELFDYEVNTHNITMTLTLALWPQNLQESSFLYPLSLHKVSRLKHPVMMLQKNVDRQTDQVITIGLLHHQWQGPNYCSLQT